MTPQQKKAWEKVGSPTFCEDDARLVLNWYYGPARIGIADGASLCEGVIRAIERLGGRYQAGWGITKAPNYIPKDGDDINV